MKKHIVYTSLVVLVLFSCKTKKVSAVEEKTETVSQINIEKETDLEKFIGNYRVVFLGGFEFLDQTNPTVKIDSKGRITGKNGCNSYFGSVDFHKDKIFQKIGSTRKACEGLKEEAENFMMDVLANITSLKKEGDILHFYVANDKMMSAKVISLEGYQWIVNNIRGIELNEIMPDFQIVKGKINGNTGCNSFFGDLIQDGFNIKFEELGISEMLCKDFDSNIEIKLMQALSEVTNFTLEKKSIHMKNVRGEKILSASKP